MAMSEAKKKDLKGRRAAPLVTPSDLGAKASQEIAGGMNAILADVWALYLKTKNFHWHMSGPHFRDYHLLLDEQADQLYAMSDPIAERIRKVGGSTLRSIGHIARLQRIKDNDADYVDPLDMLAELREDNQQLAARLREVHDVVDEARDIATASLIENWIDETERRTWFLFEARRRAPCADSRDEQLSRCSRHRGKPEARFPHTPVDRGACPVGRRVDAHRDRGDPRPEHVQPGRRGVCSAGLGGIPAAHHARRRGVAGDA